MEKKELISRFANSRFANVSKLSLVGIFAGVFCVIFAIIYTMVAFINRQKG